MGLSIYAVDERQPVPRDVVMRLRCDSDHGLFPVSEVFPCDPWYPTAHSRATRRGWKITSLEVLCPGCSGKQVRAA